MERDVEDWALCLMNALEGRFESERPAQTFVLSDGERAARLGKRVVSYVFHFRGLLPSYLEETQGELQVEERVFPVLAASVDGQRLHLTILETNEAGIGLGERVEAARLELQSVKVAMPGDEILAPAARRKLSQKAVQGIAKKHRHSLPPFLRARAQQGRVLGRSRAFSHDTTGVWEQALGSEVTYVWGLPGADTILTLAAVIAGAVELGESVLVVSSHTRLEYLIGALLGTEGLSPPETVCTAFLHDPLLVSQRGFIKIGEARYSPLPDEVVAERLAREMSAHVQVEFDDLREREQASDLLLDAVVEDLAVWERYHIAFARLEEVSLEMELKLSAAGAAKAAATAAVSTANAARSRAEQRGMDKRIRRRVTVAVEAAEAAQKIAVEKQEAAQEAERRTVRRKKAMTVTQLETEHLPDYETLVAEHRSILDQQIVISERRAGLEQESANNMTHITQKAQVIFATPFGVWTDLHAERRFDRVIVDRACTLPFPIVSTFLGKAEKRVVLADDFYRFSPPLACSADTPKQETTGDDTTDIPSTDDDEASSDIFTRAGVRKALGKNRFHPHLAVLNTQRRMRPEIAALAKKLAYKTRLRNFSEAEDRRPHGWKQYGFGNTALGLLDISELGRQPVHVSLHGVEGWADPIVAQASVELAGRCASQIPEPLPGRPAPIALLTPSLAQARLLGLLLQETGLSSWVIAGTPSSFCTEENDLVICDEIAIQECNEKEEEEFFLRATTRAREQFVLVRGPLPRNKSHLMEKDNSAREKLHHHMAAYSASRFARSVLAETSLRQQEKTPGWKAWENGTARLLAADSFLLSLQQDLAQASEYVQLRLCLPAGTSKMEEPQISLAWATQHIKELSSREVPVVAGLAQAVGPAGFDSLREAGAVVYSVAETPVLSIVIDGHVAYRSYFGGLQRLREYPPFWRFTQAGTVAVIAAALQAQVASVESEEAQEELLDLACSEENPQKSLPTS